MNVKCWNFPSNLVENRICSVIFVLLMFLCSLTALPQSKPAMTEIDRTRLAEAFRLADALKGEIWKNWEKAPFAVLLVTRDHEFLIRHPQPSSNFILLGKDD